MRNLWKYGLFIVVGSAILIPMILFGVIGNSDRNALFLPLFNRENNQDGKTQQQMNDDTFLRGAVDVSSEGKQISEKNRRHLCGSSLFPESTEFIEEYQIPFSCAQPVGIAVDGQGKVWTAATWTGHLLVFDPISESFIKFIQIPDIVPRNSKFF
jgi:hypothetical protein